MEIASGWDNHCVERAISVMRLALGYSKGLPSNWPYEMPKTPAVLAQYAGLAFPNHQIDVYVDFTDILLAPNVTNKGTITPKNGEYWANHLSAFSYGRTGKSETTHMVVGDPVIYEGMYTNIIICVELENNHDVQ